MLSLCNVLDVALRPRRARFECTFTSETPLDSLEWFRNAERVTPAMRNVTIARTDCSTALSVEDARPADSARYTVRLCNAGGVAESAATLTVRGVPFRKPVSECSTVHVTLLTVL